jgi:Tfp pilus assembly protein PilN
MNANELADMAENACCAYQKEIAAMLRQQQAEIQAAMELVKKFQEEREALKKENTHLLMVHNYKGAGFK